MDKTLGVIGLIAVAVVIFVLSIDDQTPPMTAISGKVTRQRIEAQNSAPVKDVAPNVPTSRESSDLTSSGPQLDAFRERCSRGPGCGRSEGTTQDRA